MKNTVIFDFDGTLINSLYDIQDSVNHVLFGMGFPVRSFEHVRDAVGEGAYRLMERCLPEGTDKNTLDTAARELKIWYSSHGNIKTAPYNGVVSMLEELKKHGINTAVSSNKYDAMVKNLTKKLFGDLIGFAAGESDIIPKKPDPASACAALEYFGVKKENALYVGDSEIDIATAKNAEIDIICVSWGARDKETLIKCGAPLIVDDAPSLLKAILNY